MMKRWLLGILLAVLAPIAWALPTVQDVDAQVRQGHYAEAESMMQEVIAARPQSARAHYVYAQILAHNGRFSMAAAEETRARHLDPDMKFSKPEDVRAFEQVLERERRRTPSDGTPLGSLGPATATPPSATMAATPAPPPAAARVAPAAAERGPASNGLPGWVWPVAIIALLFVVWRMLRPSNRGVAGNAAAPYGTAAYGGPGYPGAGMPGGAINPMPGGGLMGVGLAAAGGVAAGMLAEKYLERGHEQGVGNAAYDNPGIGSSLPDPDARALEDRSIDFGSGNDWGDGGSSDVGSGSDDASW
jgi:hypothetical protein